MDDHPELRELTSYDGDFLLWSEEQAELLRRRAAARPEAFAGLDIEHLVEEIADLGGAQLQAARSYLTLLFIHLIEIASDPAAPSLDHWLDEVTRFRVDFRSRYLPSMRQRIDLEHIWTDAIHLAGDRLAAHGRTVGPGVPALCPFGLDEVLARRFHIRQAVSRLGSTLPG